MYEQKIDLQSALPLLTTCGLSKPDDIDYTIGIFDDSHELIATGSLSGNIIKGMAVSPYMQGEDLSAKVVTALINHAINNNIHSLYLFTKPEKSFIFSSIGFNIVATAPPYASLLEWGHPNIDDFIKSLYEHSISDKPSSAIVMNCNPFTLGHKYLIEKSSKESETVYIFVVEEDKSLFSFKDRLAMVKSGVAHLPNVVVLSGGRYMVSLLTFPSYFTKKTEHAIAHTHIDIAIFTKQIAPALNIKKRYLGTEPLSPVTDVYNDTIKILLPQAGIDVVEIPRLSINGNVVSASRVRKALETKDWDTIKSLVPTSTYKYMNKMFEFGK